MTAKIRKPVFSLIASDFESYPFWEYASDEEGVPGQDECTVRPLALADFSPEESQVFAQARYVFPNGEVRFGVITLNAGADISSVQPTMLLPEGNLLFYRGAMEPSAEERDRFFSALKSVSEVSFPIKYQSAVLSQDGTPLISGDLEGLYWVAEWLDDELKIECLVQ
jgi:hypothetical protein